MKPASNSSSYETGVAAESLAAKLLEEKGCRLLSLRYKTKFGEVDIIALKDDMLLAVEVKRRKTFESGSESITIKQRKRIENAMLDFLSRNPALADYAVRFDAIIVAPEILPVHIEDAWRPEE